MPRRVILAVSSEVAGVQLFSVLAKTVSVSRTEVEQLVAQVVASESAAQSTALFWLGFWADLHRHLLECTAHLLPVCHIKSWQDCLEHRRCALYTPLQCASSVSTDFM